jgi:phage-related tail protein
MTRTTIPGVRGMPLPNLEAHGLARKMQPAAKLIDEQDRLRQQLEAEIKRLEHERTQAWGRAMRAGREAPTDKGIERAEKRLEEVLKESGAVLYAGDLADAELRQTVAEHTEECDALVQAKGEEILSEAQQMADALSAKLAETERLVALHGWLRSGAQSTRLPHQRPSP